MSFWQKSNTLPIAKARVLVIKTYPRIIQNLLTKARDL